MTTDRELLELAAKAAGIVNYTFHDGVFQPKCIFVETGSRRGDSGYYWSPLTDDGDALRLAVKLNLTIDFDVLGVLAIVSTRRNYIFTDRFWREWLHNDPYAATRRAIVRAAAEIGSGMRPFPSVEEIKQWVGQDD